jgi:hypothetical protein
MTGWTVTPRYIIPTVKAGPSFPKSCRHKVPRNQRDQATHEWMREAFRSGHIYAYSYDSGQWMTWATQADWDATERSTADGRVIRDQAAHDAGHGPHIYDRGFEPGIVVKAKRPTKAEAINLLRAIAEGTDWQVSDLEDLLAREAA